MAACVHRQQSASRLICRREGALALAGDEVVHLPEGGSQEVGCAAQRAQRAPAQSRPRTLPAEPAASWRTHPSQRCRVRWPAVRSAECNVGECAVPRTASHSPVSMSHMLSQGTAHQVLMYVSSSTPNTAVPRARADPTDTDGDHACDHVGVPEEGAHRVKNLAGMFLSE